MFAAWNNPNTEVIEELINAGAEVNVMDKDDETSLMKAIENNRNPKIANILANHQKEPVENALFFSTQFEQLSKKFLEKAKDFSFLKSFKV